MSTARWQDIRPWLPALLALGLAAGLQGLAVPALQQQTQAAEKAALRRLQAHAAAATADAAPNWRASLPTAAQGETRLADLLDAAARGGVQVQTVDQAPSLEPTPGVTQQRIDLSARGSYPALRRFVEQALRADSGLALEHLSLQRAQADAPELDARLRLSLLQRADDSATASAGREASTSSTAAPRTASDTAAGPRGPWRAPWAEAIAAWSAPQPLGLAGSAPTRPAPAKVAATPPAAPPPQPSPRAPALAYELIGTVADAAGPGALLAGAERSLWVRAGDTVDSAWRVQRVDASGVDLLWLPQRLPARLNYRTP